MPCFGDTFPLLLWPILSYADGSFTKRPEENAVRKINQEELKQKIEKLKKTASEKKTKTEGKKSAPDFRSALKKVKRAQRKLRSAKAYKSAGKKAGEDKAAAPAS
jgi:hypothetical protein